MRGLPTIQEKNLIQGHTRQWAIQKTTNGGWLIAYRPNGNTEWFFKGFKKSKRVAKDLVEIHELRELID